MWLVPCPRTWFKSGGSFVNFFCKDVCVVWSHGFPKQHRSGDAGGRAAGD